MMPVYEKLFESGADLKILVYSGDDDTLCSTRGTVLKTPSWPRSWANFSPL